MISVDFDSAHIPAGTTSELCIIKCGKIRLSMRGTPRKQNMRFTNNKKTGLKDCTILKGDREYGVVSVEGLNYENFLVMIKDRDSSDKNAKVFSARQVIFLPKEFKDWTGTLKK